MASGRSVFERIDDALRAHKGISLSFGDLELLRQLVGDELDKAEGEYERWRELFREYDDLQQRFPAARDDEAGKSDGGDR